MSHARLVRDQIRQVIETFLRGQSSCNPVTGKVICENGQIFDAEFGTHRNALYEAHQANCPVCAENKNCVAIDALIALTPDPCTGVISLFHDFLLRHGRFDAITTKGEIFITPRAN